MSFDNRGRKFVCSNSSHLQALMYEDRYAARNPYASLPRALADIAVDGGAAPVFRISPDEPWRVIRTQWRVNGLVPGPVEGGGRPSGYFTGATGVTIYRGDAFPQEFVGNAFVGDAGGNLVHRKLILSDGVGLKGVRPADEERVEFLASTDNWFRPVQMANAPDGCLYICDMYREVIEHPWSLPDSIKKHLDLNSGNDRGRIYRVVPEHFKQPKLPHLSKASTKKLVAMLTLANGWHRDTAARLLFERQPKAAVSLLAELATNSPVPVVRVHALHTLAGLGAFDEDLALAALDTKLPEIRVQVIRLCEQVPGRPGGSRRVWEKLVAASDEYDPEVRRQMAFTLGTLPRSNRIEIAVQMAKRHASIYSDLLASSIGDEAGEIFATLAARDPGLVSGAGGLLFLIGAYQRPAEIDAALNALATAVPARKQRESMGIDNENLLTMAASLASGMERGGGSLSRFANDPRLQPIFRLAQQWATQPELTSTNPRLRFTALGTPVRVRRGDALTVLGYAPSEFALPTLLEALERYPHFASEALAALSRHWGAPVAANLLERWPRLGAETRVQVIAFLMKRTENASVLLDSVGTGKVKRTELSAAQIEFLRTHRNPAIRDRAARLLAPERDASRQEVVKAFEAALSLGGNARKGAALFESRCMTCHQLRGRGYALGPDLATVKNAGREKVLVNILDPNREVNSNYLAYSIETRDGDSLVGLLVNQNANSVTLRMASGSETVVPRSGIASMQSQGRSLMPEGLEEGLSMQDMADLLEFILAP
jgi:putative heme-binding domain-containing protein